jgi:chromatin remodeling complex protein RSC6
MVDEMGLSLESTKEASNSHGSSNLEIDDEFDKKKKSSKRAKEQDVQFVQMSNQLELDEQAMID